MRGIAFRMKNWTPASARRWRCVLLALLVLRLRARLRRAEERAQAVGKSASKQGRELANQRTRMRAVEGIQQAVARERRSMQRASLQLPAVAGHGSTAGLNREA